jgi:hypothetical protein
VKKNSRQQEVWRYVGGLKRNSQLWYMRQLYFQHDGYGRTTKLNFNSLTLPNFHNGLTVFQIPPQRQAPNAGGNTSNTTKLKQKYYIAI